jgi:CDP-diacylglycerol---serine O-phosphatidyltransferase
LLLPMFVSFEWGDWIPRSPYLNAVWISAVALLMVSTVPTMSLKRIRIPPHLVVPSLLGVGVMAGFFMTAPWPTLTFVGALYIGSIPLTIRAYMERRRAYEIRKTEQTESPQPTAALPATPPLPLGEATPPANEWRH